MKTTVRVDTTLLIADSYDERYYRKTPSADLWVRKFLETSKWLNLRHAFRGLYDAVTFFIQNFIVVLELQAETNSLEGESFTTMFGAIGRFVRLQYYRYSIVTGLYIMGNIESTIIQLTFFVFLYFLVRYTCTFFSQLSSSGLPGIQH